MRKLFHILTLVVVVLAMSSAVFAQATQPTITTLSSAVSSANATVINVTSATGFTASNSFTGTDYGIFVDHEFMRIVSINGTQITVQRGQASTVANPHKSGARVYEGGFANQQGPSQAGGPFVQNQLVGACTISNYPYMPLIQVNANAIGGQAMYNCLNGQWRPQTLIGDVEDSPLVLGCAVPVGSVAYASFGSSVDDVAGANYRGSTWVTKSGVFTGIQVLQGATATTDKIAAAVYDAGGNLIANTASAGVSLSGANTFLPLPFGTTTAAPVIITGPARYWFQVQGNGTAAGAFRAVAAATFIDVLGTTVSGTFGAFVSSFTPVTTFAASVAPIACLYY